MRICHFLGVLSVLFGFTWSLPAFAASHCLVSNEVACQVKVDKQGFRIQVDERGQIIAVFGNSKADLERAESYVVVQEDLDRLEANQSFTPNESAQIRAELTNYDGTAYMIPEAEELKAALNLPATEVIAAHDYVDLIQVHMQLVLSFSAFTSSYLGELMGVAALDDAPTTAALDDAPVVRPAGQPPAAVQVAPTPTPTPTPEPTPAPEPAAEVQTQS